MKKTLSRVLNVLIFAGALILIGRGIGEIMASQIDLGVSNIFNGGFALICLVWSFMYERMESRYKESEETVDKLLELARSQADTGDSQDKLIKLYKAKIVELEADSNDTVQ